MTDKHSNWMDNLINELDKSSSGILEAEYILDEIITKLNTLISEINNYISEIHFGLKITNEKINVSISELNELENKLKEYLLTMEQMKRSVENTSDAIDHVRNEMIGIKQSLEESSFKINNRYNFIEHNLKQHGKKIELLNNSIKNLSKNQEHIIKSLNSTRTLLYVTIVLTVLNILISLKTSGIIG